MDFLCNVAHVGSDLFTDFVRKLADDGPDRFFRVFRHQRQVETHQLVICLRQLEGFFARADFLCDAVQFVIEYITQALGKDERQDEVLVLGCILGPANGTGRIPDPGLDGFILLVVCSSGFSDCFFSGCYFLFGYCHNPNLFLTIHHEAHEEHEGSNITVRSV